MEGFGIWDLKFEIASRIGDDFGDADLALGLVRGVLEDGLHGEALVRGVIAHAAKDRGAGINAGDVEFRERFHVTENRF
jgi:hypothetical protein